MRKLIAMIAALAMVMSMSVSVFAAQSPIADGATPEGNVEVKAIDENSAAAKELGTTKENIEANIPKVMEKNFGEDLSDKTVELLYAADISSEDSVVVFTVKDALNGADVYALHWNVKTNKWENLKVEVNGDAVTVYFENGYSPVYLFAVKDANPESEGENEYVPTPVEPTLDPDEEDPDTPPAEGGSYKTGC